MSKDIKNQGYVSESVIYFDGFFNRNGHDKYGLSFLTHLIYLIPSKEKKPDFYQNEDFLDQLSLIGFYRVIYKIIGVILLLDIAFIAVMTNLYGDNIK